jgi:aryl carrier-like protein
VQLREYLERILPDYMIPSQYSWLEQLPLTANGKVDRMALPAPDLASAAQELELPVTPTEVTLERVWRKVLRVEGRIGVHENFFARGGDSILAISLMAQAGKSGLKLTIQQVFESPTIAEMAVLLTEAQAADAEQERAHGAG